MITEATLKLRRSDADAARARMKSESTINAHRDAWCGERCTLAGRPARVVGRRHPVATVATLAEPWADAEYSWPAVARIMADGGNFKG